MVEEVGLQYDDCQVLEYQPDNQWTTVGQLETARRNHAVLSIGSETLPCLQGYLEQDDVFVELQLSSSRLSLPKTFHNDHPPCHYHLLGRVNH